MTNIYLVRHGKKHKIPGDPSLTEEGIVEAKKTAVFFKDKYINAIYSSPLKRCLETAGIIGSELNLSIEIDNRLRERFNWGDVRNQSFSEFYDEWIKSTKDRDYKPSVGDSSRDCGKRMEEMLLEVTQKHEGKNIVLVSSGGSIADLIRNLFDEDFMRDIKEDTVEGIQECSITHISKTGDDAFKLEAKTITRHLE